VFDLNLSIKNIYIDKEEDKGMASKNIFMQTIPFLMLRSMVYTGYAVILLLILWFLIQMTRTAGVWSTFAFFLACFVIAFFMWKGIYKSFFYLIEQAHLIMLSKYVSGNSLPQLPVHEGVEQWKKLFSKSSFFQTRQLLLKSLTQITLFRQPFLISYFFIDQAVWQYVYGYQGNIWSGLRDGCIVLFKTKKKIMQTALTFNSFLWGISAFFFLFFYMLIAKSVPVLNQAPFFFSLIVMSWIKISLFDQIALPFLLRSFHKIMDTEKPDEESLERAETASYAFKEIVAKSGRNIQPDPYIQQLIPYIQQYLHQGWARTQIKQSLVKNGWPASSVDAALQKL